MPEKILTEAEREKRRRWGDDEREEREREEQSRLLAEAAARRRQQTVHHVPYVSDGRADICGQISRIEDDLLTAQRMLSGPQTENAASIIRMSRQSLESVRRRIHDLPRN